jgi:L-alanine-DL-glutamate epimerase-like enolase superfamily enzyme
LILIRDDDPHPWLQGGAFDIVQPDVTKVGAISEERRIAWMAEDNGIRCIPHGWNTAVGLAADLHLASASRNTDMVEYLTGYPFVDDIAENKRELDDSGMLVVPNGPGLGISLNLDTVRKHTGQRFGSP